MAKATGVEVARISVKVSPNTKEFRADLKRELEEIERTVKGDVHLNAHLNTAQARADFARMKSQMEKHGRINVGVDLNGGKGGKGKGGFPGGVPDLPDFPKLSGFPSFGSGINPAGWAVIIGAIVTAAGPLVGIVSTLAATIPGLVGTLAAPIAAITLGLEGFGKAAERIKPQFEALKKTMSDAALNTFGPVMDRIANVIFPALSDKLPLVTEGLANMSQGILDAFARPENAEKFRLSIERIGKGFSDMRPGMDGFTSGIIGMIDQFTLKFPSLSKWINETGASFDAWVAKVSADGSLQSAFSNLGTILKGIGDTITQLAGKGIEFLSDPDKVQMTLDILEGIKDTLNLIMDISGGIAKAWSDAFGSGIDNPNANTAGKGRGRVLPSAKGFDGSKTEVENLNKSIKETAAQAEVANNKVSDLLDGGGAGGANAGRERRGLAPVEPIPAPDLEPAKTEITEYQSFVDDVSQQVRGALSQATSGETLPAPNFEAFKAAWRELPGVVQSSISALNQAAATGVQGVVDAFRVAGNVIVMHVQQWPGAIAQALVPCYQIGLNAGNQVAAGMANGITAGTPFIAAAAQNAALAAKAAAENALGIKSPSRVFMDIGDNTAKGFGIGMENGFQPVLEQAKDLASKVADAFSAGGDPTGLLSGMSKQEVSRIGKVLSFENKRLESQARALDYQAKMAGKGPLADSLKARADEIRSQKEQISLQKDMLDLTREYSGELDGAGGGDDPFVKAASGLMNAPADFAKATGKQFLSDLGINGDGFISKAITEGISYIFNIASVDEAMSVKDRQDSKQAMTITGR